MRKIVYYVASSLDGFISGFNDDINGFEASGNGVDKYISDLASFDTVIMGRNTYEFGYKYGLQPGQPVYPNMKHYIFSNKLRLENLSPNVQVMKLDINEIENLQKQKGTEIYLCGGGHFILKTEFYSQGIIMSVFKVLKELLFVWICNIIFREQIGALVGGVRQVVLMG